MLNNLDQRIHNSLHKLANAKDCVASSDDLDNGSVTGENNIVNLLIERGLANPVKPKIIDFNEYKIEIPTCKISQLGIDIIRKGGWLRYLEKKKVTERRAEQKEKFDFIVSKWKYHTFWIFFSLAIFGGGYSAYDLITKIVGENIPKETQTAKKSEIENPLIKVGEKNRENE